MTWPITVIMIHGCVCVCVTADIVLELGVSPFFLFTGSLEGQQDIYTKTQGRGDFTLGILGRPAICIRFV